MSSSSSPSSSGSEAQNDSDIEPEVRKPTPRRLLRGPKLGSFQTSKTFIIMESESGKILKFRGPSSRGTNTLGSRPQSSSHPDISPFSCNTIASTFSTPLLIRSADLMMGSALMFDTNGFDGSLGPAEAFYPIAHMGADGRLNDGSSSLEEDDLDPDDIDIDINDFFDFSSDDSGNEEDVEDEDPSSDSGATYAAFSSPSRPNTAGREDQVNHLFKLDSARVGSFRKHQNNHVLLARGGESIDSLAFQGPNGSSTIRGIRNGMLSAANTPITPVRKRKAVRPLSMPGHSSPITHVNGGLAEDKKRKADSFEPARGHKRNKSMV